MFWLNDSEKIKNTIRQKYPNLSGDEILELTQRYINFAKVIIEIWLKNKKFK